MKETLMDKNWMKYSIGLYSQQPQVRNDVYSVLHTNHAHMHFIVAFFEKCIFLLLFSVLSHIVQLYQTVCWQNLQQI